MRWKRKIKIRQRKSIDRLIERYKVKPYRCPCCGKELHRHRYTEEYHGEVEGGYICRVCGYEDYHSYGTTMLAVGKWEGGYSYSTPEEKVFAVQREFERQIAIARQEWKWSRQFYYRKKKRQRKGA